MDSHIIPEKEDNYPYQIPEYNPDWIGETEYCDPYQIPEPVKVGITKHLAITQPITVKEHFPVIPIEAKNTEPIYCLRCKQMKATRDNPNISTIECGTCMNNYCYDCYNSHKRGKCYICREPGCYIHEIRKIVCYICL